MRELTANELATVSGGSWLDSIVAGGAMIVGSVVGVVVATGVTSAAIAAAVAVGAVVAAGVGIYFIAQGVSGWTQEQINYMTQLYYGSGGSGG